MNETARTYAKDLLICCSKHCAIVTGKEREGIFGGVQEIAREEDRGLEPTVRKEEVEKREIERRRE